MNIVILDGYTINSGDLDWAPLERLGTVTIYDRTAIDKIAERAIDAEIVLTNKAKVSDDIIRNLPKLKYIGEMATGFDNVGINAAAERNIPVCNVPGYSTHSVAQLTFAFILELIYKTGARSADVKDGAWTRSEDFSFGHKGLFELYGKTIALIGLGKIGTAVAKIANAFGMRVIANVRHPERYTVSDVLFTGKEECCREADVLSLHCPLTEETKGMVNQSFIELMKPSSFVINTARGGVINEADLAKALNGGRIAGAGLDVLSSEPPRDDNPLLKAANCIITPHIAWATREARGRVLNETVRNIEAFLAGNPRNVVNGVG